MPTSSQLPRFRASAICDAGVLQPAQRLDDAGLSTLVGAHHPRDGISGHSGSPREAQQNPLFQLRKEVLGEPQRRDGGIAVVETEEMESAERRGTLILAPTGKTRFHRLELPPIGCGLLAGQRLSPGNREHTYQCHIQRARASQPRPNRDLGEGTQGAGSRREHSQRRSQQGKRAVPDQLRGMSDHRRFTEIFRPQQHPRATQLDLGSYVEADRGIYDQSSLAGREGRHIGPPAGKVEPDRCRRMEQAAFLDLH